MDSVNVTPFIIIHLRVISGFFRKVGENCTVLCYYAANSGNSLLTF